MVSGWGKRWKGPQLVLLQGSKTIIWESDRSHEKEWTYWSCASLIHVLLIWFMCFSEVSYFPQHKKGISNKTKTEGESLNHHNFPKHEAQVTFNLSTGQNKRKRKKQKQKQNSIKNITFLLFVKFVLR